MIQHQEAVYKWQFAYLGANVDAFAEAGQLRINQAAAAAFAPTVGGVSAMFTAATESTTTYRNGGAYTISHTQRAAMKDDVTTGSGGV